MDKKGKVKRGRRSQVTVFIIIAIIIAAVIIASVYFYSRSNTRNSPNPEISPVYDFVKDCIKHSGYESLRVIGSTGGNSNMKLKTDSFISYYLYDGNITSPAKKDIEKEIGLWTGYFSNLCLSNLSSFSEFSVDIGNISSNAKINNESVQLNVDLPVKIAKGDKTFNINNFNDIEIPVRLGYVFDISNEIVDENSEHPESLCLNCLYETGKRSGLLVSVHDIDLDKSIIILSDPKSKIQNGTFALAFAIKFKKSTNGGIIDEIQ